MESTGIFEKRFFKVLREDNIAGVGGSLGGGAGFDPGTGEINSADWYAPGDARNPTPVGKVQTRKGSIKGKKGKKRVKWPKRKNLYLTGSENEEELEGKLKEKSE